MITHIKVCSRQWMDGLVKGDHPSRFFNFCQIANGQSWHLISIYSEHGPTKNNFDCKKLMVKDTVKLYQSLGMLSYTDFRFMDITDKDEDIIQQYGKDSLFDTFTALKIRDYLLNLKADTMNNSVLVVHCQAGISRSGAVGLYSNDLLQLDYFKFIKLNPEIQPNPWISHILNQTDRAMSGTSFNNL